MARPKPWSIPGDFGLAKQVVNWLCMNTLIFSFDQSEKIRRFEESKLLRKKELNSDKIGLLPRAKVTNEEHPLSFGKSSLWNQYFQVLLITILNKSSRLVGNPWLPAGSFTGINSYGPFKELCLVNLKHL